MDNPQNQPYPYRQEFTSPPMPVPMPPRKPPFDRRRGCLISLVVVVVLFFAFVVVAIASTPSSPPAQASATPTQASQATHAPAVAQYPPKTKADLQALAAKGDASAVHEFHSESVGLTGVCPQPKREVTVDPSVTGQQLAEDLLAYFYSNQLDSACGSVVFAFHTQAEANGDNGYTAGRILFDTANADGSANYDPNATGLKYTLTLDTTDALTSGQEYMVNY